MSYRALFNWINPWVFFPHTLGYPIFEILFFAYLGRFADVESDKFFLIGNAFMAIAITGFFGMGNSIGGERRSQTLSTLLASPANRFALFLGRAVPSILTGFLVAAMAFTICSLILGVHFTASKDSADSPSQRSSRRSRARRSACASAGSDCAAGASRCSPT